MFSSFETANIDVLIIGGGLSGMVSCYKIKEKAPTLKISILEASDKLGGQLYNTDLGEIGAKWILNNQYHIYNLCRNLRVKLRKRSIIENDEFSRCWENDEGILSSFVNFELSRFVDEINIKCMNTVKFILNKNENTVEDYIRSKLLFEKSRMFIRIIVRIACGVETTEISITEFMNVCHSCEGFINLIDLIIGKSDRIFEFSSEELLENILNSIETANIITNTKVIEILHKKNKIMIRDNHDNIYSCSVLILAIPWENIMEINFLPELPSNLHIITSKDNSNYLTSFLIEYNQSFWKKLKFSGSFLCYDPPIIGYEIKSGIYGGIYVHKKNSKDNCNLKTIILNKLIKCYGNNIKFSNKWIEKTFKQHKILNLPQIVPWNHIIFSSTDNATYFRGFLNGAVQSGIKAAIDALLIIRPQTVNWEDMAEIQKANAVYIRKNWFYLLTSSLNIYNTLYYGLISGIIALAYVFRNVFKEK